MVLKDRTNRSRKIGNEKRLGKNLNVISIKDGNEILILLKWQFTTMPGWILIDYKKI